VFFSPEYQPASLSQRLRREFEREGTQETLKLTFSAPSHSRGERPPWEKHNISISQRPEPLTSRFLCQTQRRVEVIASPSHMLACSQDSLQYIILVGGEHRAASLTAGLDICYSGARSSGAIDTQNRSIPF
jgi:hypothetical protein